eukprot:SAG31_NODE_844_length_11549_cov_2.985852_9_plen_98_part_00
MRMNTTVHETLQHPSLSAQLRPDVRALRLIEGMNAVRCDFVSSCVDAGIIASDVSHGLAAFGLFRHLAIAAVQSAAHAVLFLHHVDALVMLRHHEAP